MQDYFNRFPAREKQKAGEAWHYIPGLKSRGSEAFSEKWKIIFFANFEEVSRPCRASDNTYGLYGGWLVSSFEWKGCRRCVFLNLKTLLVAYCTI